MTIKYIIFDLDWTLIDSSKEFFKWIPEKIFELSKKYKLFLSTRSSTKSAEEYLKKWWIYDCFEYILWSEKICKSKQHIDFFKEITLDKDFEKFSIFIWDWEIDRFIAKETNIIFIHIDKNLEKNFYDKLEINSINEIEKIFKEIKKLDFL